MVRGGKIALLAAATLLTAHVASPYAATWRMWQAARAGDADTLSALIDWQQVRSALKQDIADGIVGMRTQELVASNTLAPFGSSFMAGIAGSIVDRDVTPEHLAIALRGLRQDDRATDQGAISYAFFSSPTEFELALRAPGQDDDDPPLRLKMAWHNFGWHIVRAIVPQDLMEQASFDN